MIQYQKLVSEILYKGVEKTDRTGTGTRSIFGHQMRFDLSTGFPLVTSKKTNMRSVILELLWFLSGSTNARDLSAEGVNIWNDWAGADGELGPIYGYQWRNWPNYDGTHIDQIRDVVAQIKANPDSRRHIVCSWNVAMLPDMALPPCHCLFQFYVANGVLSCQLYQRSADVFLGVPFNIASYALLTRMIAKECNLEAGEFIWTGGDCHLYNNHLDQARLMLSREPKPLPSLIITPESRDICHYSLDDFVLVDYDPHPFIAAPIAV